MKKPFREDDLLGNLLRNLAHRLPKSLKYAIIRILSWRDPQRKNASWIKRTASWVKQHSSIEMVFCPNGEVFERDKTGLEFLIPVHLTNRIKIGAISNPEVVETQLLLNNLQPGDVMFDIGANVGMYSIRAAKTIPGLCVYAFEPVAANFKVLQRNIERNRLETRINSMRLAVGENNGFVRVHSEYGTGNFVVSGTSEIFSYGPIEDIEMISIDLFIEKANIQSVAAIKCDVEGYELNVLRGAQNCLTYMRPYVLLELFDGWARRFDYHPEVVFQLMENLNYRYIRITNKREVLPASEDLYKDLKEGNNFFFCPSER